MLNGTESIRPLRDRVLVKELPWRNQTASGIHLPDQAQKGDHVWRALVVAVGPGKPPLELLRKASNALHTGYDQIFPRGDAAAEIDRAIDDGFGIDGVKPGDVVLVSKYIHSKIGYGEETLCCVAATDILGVVEGEANDLRRALETALAKLDAWDFAGDTEPPPEDGPPLSRVAT